MSTVLCHGVFDLLHVGHLNHLLAAKVHGNELIVSVLADKFVTKYTPINTQQDRLMMVSALQCVDGVYLCTAYGPDTIIKELRPDIYVRGAEYEGKEMPESQLLRDLGIPVRYTPPCSPHTSEIIERILRSRNGGKKNESNG